MWLSAEIYSVWGGCRNFPKRPPQRVAAFPLVKPRDVKSIRPKQHLLRATVTIFVGLIRPPSVEQVLFGSLAQQRVVPMHWTALLICCWMGGDMLASRTLLENAWNILWPKATPCAVCDKRSTDCHHLHLHSPIPSKSCRLCPETRKIFYDKISLL